MPLELIERRIYVIRDQKVMVDSDLAELYQVATFRLNEAVKRNRDRFPDDFMFQLTKEEADALTSQFAMSNSGRGGRRTRPYAFSEHGVAMLSSVLKSPRAVQMNIAIIRLRQTPRSPGQPQRPGSQNRRAVSNPERSRRTVHDSYQGHREPGQRRERGI